MSLIDLNVTTKTIIVVNGQEFKSPENAKIYIETQKLLTSLAGTSDDFQYREQMASTLMWDRKWVIESMKEWLRAVDPSFELKDDEDVNVNRKKFTIPNNLSFDVQKVSDYDEMIKVMHSLLIGGKLINAIKLVRAYCPCGLKDGKDFVVRYREKHEIAQPLPSGY